MWLLLSSFRLRTNAAVLAESFALDVVLNAARSLGIIHDDNNVKNIINMVI
jgi:hypothetical protein